MKQMSAAVLGTEKAAASVARHKPSSWTGTYPWIVAIGVASELRAILQSRYCSEQQLYA